MPDRVRVTPFIPRNERAGACNYVFSRTLPASKQRHVTVGGDPDATVAALRERAGKDIWLGGGGVLFASLVGNGLVDTVELPSSPSSWAAVPAAPAPVAARAARPHREPRRYPAGSLPSATR